MRDGAMTTMLRNNRSKDGQTGIAETISPPRYRTSSLAWCIFLGDPFGPDACFPLTRLVSPGQE